MKPTTLVVTTMDKIYKIPHSYTCIPLLNSLHHSNSGLFPTPRGELQQAPDHWCIAFFLLVCCSGTISLVEVVYPVLVKNNCDLLIVKTTKDTYMHTTLDACMYKYIYICVHIYIYVCIHYCITLYNTYIYMNEYIYIYINCMVYVYIYMCIHSIM